MAKVIQVIETYELRGGGIMDNDLSRRVRQFWSLEGELLMEHDPCLTKMESKD